MTDPLQQRLAELEGAEAALVLASGRAATACTLLALLRPGDHLLASEWLRPETRDFFTVELPALGVDVTFTNPRDTRGWRRDLRKTTRALFVESPVLDTGRPVDLRPPRALSVELGIALIVDATAASPVNFTPLAHGADVVLHDARVLLDSQGAGEAGVVCGTDGVIDEVRQKMTAWGAVPHPASLTQLAQGLATLQVRVAHQNACALRVAEWARSAPGVHAVEYAGLAGDSGDGQQAEWMHGGGPVLLLTLTQPTAGRLVCEQLAAHLDAAQTIGDGVVTQARLLSPDGPLRLRVGLELADAIIAALATSLAAVAATAPPERA